MVVTTGPDRAQQRALDELEDVVGHARPQLVDAFDALAFIESLGYTDARVQREFGLRDVRGLADYLFDRLSDRAMPVSPSPYSTDVDIPGAGQQRRWLAAVAIVVAWVAVAIASRVELQPWVRPLPTALMASVVVWAGFIEAVRRRSGFYLALGQTRIARVTCWYFVRVAALASLVIAAIGFGAAVLGGVAWPLAALTTDEFLAWAGVWSIVAALQLPSVLSSGRDATPSGVPIPRMTIVGFHELRTIAIGTAAAILAFAPRFFANTVVADAIVTVLLAAMAVVLRRIPRRESI